MRKTLKYRIYPTKAQIRGLEGQIDICRKLYNYLLDFNRERYQRQGLKTNLYDQNRHVVQLKILEPSLGTVNAQVLQQVSTRVSLAFQGFFRRVRAGQIPGYPRFKTDDRYHSLTYPQWCGNLKIIGGNRIGLPGIGNVKLHFHRPLEGNPKTVTVRRTATGKWFVTISCDQVPVDRFPPTGKNVGIDVGKITFAVGSDGLVIKRKKFLKHDQDRIAKTKAKLARIEDKATRGRVRRNLAKLYEHVTNRRLDWCHKQANEVIKNYDVICVEKLDIGSMLGGGSRDENRNTGDVAWGLFRQLLTYKAEEAGRLVVAVNPCNTTKRCSNCSQLKPMPTNIRTYECPCCPLVMDRDLNAAINILRLGTQSLTANPV